ncbi:ABC-type polysaccharide/polyol phosphate export system, permease component [Saccharomonospora marina XMU15]|uniref:Transport permease protein n=1 Tax=Saccharomonospora marina XMU15 TaxID=882083 RepID=H5X7V7_9PSEU|nr:ABC transporter permease [Saccharomonospora marina]EHR52457.1 ABC-type polysaccharide/polyol phosphate export system, permease component [Saccharomonospora marina XMU15]
MTTAIASHPLRDSATMVRRNLKRMVRYPSMTVQLIAMPVLLLLLFVYVFGGTLGTGLGGPSGGRAEYVNYVVPAILVITIATVVQGTAISVAMDMTEGIIARFRTMNIARVSVLTGHVIGSLIQALLGLAAVTGVALLIGFQPRAGLGDWLALGGLLTAATFALVWLTVAIGQASQSVEAASNLPMPLMFLPFLGSGFVPTDSMPEGVRWFAEYQPFTPIMESIRALLLDQPLGNELWIALAWCAGIALAGYVWAKRLYNRKA